MVYAVFGVFLIVTLLSIINRNWLISTYLAGVYTFMMLFAIILGNSNDYYGQFSFTLVLPSTLFAILMLFYFLPYCKEKPEIIHDESDEFIRRFCRIGYITSLVIILGMVLLFPYIIRSITTGLGTIRRAMYQEDTTYVTYGILGNIGQRILSRFGWIGYTNMLMFFYSLIYIKRKALLKVMLFVSSLGPVWIGILNGGRTNTVYWILYLFFCIFVFYKEFNFNHKGKVLAVLVIAALVVGRYFIFATNERLSVSSNYSTSSEFLLRYAGESFANFNYYFTKVNWHPYTLRRELPFLTSLIFGKLNLTEYRDIIQYHTGVQVSSFSTFLGTIYVDTGIIGMIIYTLVYHRTAKKLMRENSFNLRHLIYLGILYQIPLMGVFYYSYYKADISIQILILIIMARYMDLDKKPFRIKIFGGKSLQI